MVLQQPQSTEQWQQPRQYQQIPTQNLQWGPQAMGSPQFLSKSEFYKHPNLNKVRKEIDSVAICLYICAGISFIVLIAIYSIVSTFKFHKLYQEYINTGVIPLVPEKGKR